MGILADKSTRVVVQGITGREGLFHSERMLEYGTQVVGGVRPGKGGEWVLDGKVPVFDSVKVAVDATGADCSMIIVPEFSSAGCHAGGRRLRHPANYLFDRRHPYPGHDARARLFGFQAREVNRPQLPRPADAG